MREYDETNTIFGVLDSHGWTKFLVANGLYFVCLRARSDANTGEVSFILCAGHVVVTSRRNAPPGHVPFKIDIVLRHRGTPIHLDCPCFFPH